MTHETRFQRLVLYAFWLVLQKLYTKNAQYVNVQGWERDYRTFMKDTSE